MKNVFYEAPGGTCLDLAVVSYIIRFHCLCEDGKEK